jgi:hypothetical protein
MVKPGFVATLVDPAAELAELGLLTGFSPQPEKRAVVTKIASEDNRNGFMLAADAAELRERY